MAEHSGSSIFAGRYRYEPVDDGDESQGRFTELVYDLKTERLGILKRAEVTSERAVHRLKNEVEALQALKGVGVPEVYDIGEAEDDIDYFYIVLEYIDGLHVERNLDSIPASERVEILRQFFRLLAEAHQRDIVNGDINLRHLYWNKDKKQLIVIDWSQARLNVDPQQQTEFADDLARAAGILFSLVTLNGYPLPMKSFALPDESGLLPELPKLPIEFRNICFWAPRTSPAEGVPYHTALELFEAS
ncbi:MAG TPA: phosphotransferase, partial [Anaerolineales bacterium]|nr:phosphotransferase [Anaerolineales bacterium]